MRAIIENPLIVPALLLLAIIVACVIAWIFEPKDRLPPPAKDPRSANQKWPQDLR